MGALARIDDLLAAVQAAGATIRRDGNFLDIEAPAPLPEDLLVKLREAKPAIMLALGETGPQAEAGDPWNADDSQADLDQRAGTAEGDGGLPRAQAEANAYESVVAHWENNNPAASSPRDGCARCGRWETPEAKVVPFGIGPHVWLHHACWAAWSAARRAEATTALAAIGIPTPSDEEKNCKIPV